MDYKVYIERCKELSFKNTACNKYEKQLAAFEKTNPGKSPTCVDCQHVYSCPDAFNSCNHSGHCSQDTED